MESSINGLQLDELNLSIAPYTAKELSSDLYAPEVVNDQMIGFLMGQKRDTYSEWTNRYDELLEIFKVSLPTLDKKDNIQEVINLAASRGFNLDPRTLARCRDIRVDPNDSPRSNQAAGAQREFWESHQ